MPSEYIVEIYAPGSWENVWAVFQSEHPFMTMMPGELLNTAVFEPSNWAQYKIARIVNVEHILWNYKGKPKHKILVYTEEVDDTREHKRYWRAP
jgi:hypothetical protein